MEKQYKALTLSPINESKYALRVTISSPPMNIIGHGLLTEIYTFLTSIYSAINPPKVVVFSSADPEFWISHLDLHVISAQYPLPHDQDAGEILHKLGETLRLFNSLPTIFIAEINGRAVGGGNEFLLNMDMRFVGPNARLGIPEVAGGVVHGGALQRLTQLIGPGRAMEWNLSARSIDSKEAARIGWVNSAYSSSEELRAYVDALATSIALFPRGGIEATKKGIQECLAGTGSSEKNLERLRQLVHTEEAQAAISSFIELGENQSRGRFELEIPEACSQVWQN